MNVWHSACMALPKTFGIGKWNECNDWVRAYRRIHVCKCWFYFILGSDYYYYYKWQMNRMRERLRFNWNDKRHIHHFDSLNPNKTKPNWNQFSYWGKKEEELTLLTHTHRRETHTVHNFKPKWIYSFWVFKWYLHLALFFCFQYFEKGISNLKSVFPFPWLCRHRSLLIFMLFTRLLYFGSWYRTMNINSMLAYIQTHTHGERAKVEWDHLTIIPGAKI